MAVVNYVGVSTFICIISLISDIAAQSIELKYNCFTDSPEGTCEESRVKICEDFYSCDMVVPLSSPPKRIGHKDGDIFFSAGGKTYGITSGSNKAEPIVRAIPPVDELYDKKGNVYFGGDGTSYVVLKGTGKEIEIVTTKSYSYNQHALDVEANKLFILSFNSDANPNDRTGQIYAVTIDPLVIVNDKVNAELVNGIGDEITALGVQGGLDVLLLGVKAENGGKLIRLRRQKYDSCSRNQNNKMTIINLLNEVQGKIIEIIDAAPARLTRNGVFTGVGIDNEVTLLSRENIRLKIELNTTNNKLKIFSNKLMGFSGRFQKPRPIYNTDPPSYSRYPAEYMPDYSVPEEPLILNGESQKPTQHPMRYPTSTQVPWTTTDQYTFNGKLPSTVRYPLDCLPQGEILRLRAQVNELISSERETQMKFDALIREVNLEVNQSI